MAESAEQKVEPRPARSRMHKRWRAIFRRSRVYIPLLALVLLALAILLPLSPPWLKGYVERRIADETGLTVTIDKLRLHLAFGKVDLYGVALHGEADESPFRVDSVHLDGTLAELVAGDGHWPATVRVLSPSEAKVRQTEAGMIEPVGELATLIGAITRIAERERPEREEPSEEEGDEALAFLDRPLPSVQIQNVRFSFEPWEDRLPPLAISLDSVELLERIGGTDRLRAEFTGTATSGTSESISGSVTLLPESESLRVAVNLSGIAGRFTLPELGPAAVDARQLQMEASVGRLTSQAWQGNLKLTAQRFELEETSLGGERWIERNIELLFEGVLDPETNELDNVRLTLDGEQLDIRLAGRVTLDEDYIGDARLRINRLPSAVMEVGRREAAREVEGLRLDRREGARIQADLHARGSFAQLAELDYEGSVEVAQWTVSHSSWPEPLLVHEATGTLTRTGLELSQVEVELGGMTGRGQINLPFPREGEEAEQQATFSATLRGSPERSLGLLRHAGLLPSEINTATMPLSLEVSGTVPYRRVEEVGDLPLDLERTQLSGTLSWESGEAFLRDLTEPIKVSSGTFSFTERSARFSHLSAEYKGLALTIDMSAESDRSILFERPDFSIYLRGRGQIPAMLQLAGQIAPDLILPDDIEGNVIITARAVGALDDLNALDYDITLNIAEGAGIVPLPDGDVRVTEARADIRLRPHEIRLSRVSVNVAELAEIALAGTVTEEEIAVDFNVSADLAVVPVVAGREVADLYFEGTGSGQGSAQLIPREPIEPGPDVLRRWIQTLAGPNARMVDIGEEAPLRVVLNAQLQPGENVSVFHRDFPVAARNLRGDARADETGFQFYNLRGDLGSTENLLVREARVALGIGGRLVRITFDAELPYIDTNEWMDGWGEQPWAERPFTGPRVPRDRGPEPRLISQIDGTFRAREAKVFNNYATDAVGRIFFDAYRNDDNTVEIQVERATVYEGEGVANLRLLFPQDGGPTRLGISARGDRVKLNPFFADLTGEPQEFVGTFEGVAEFGGTIGNYDDWVGSGDMIVTDSQFIGSQALVAISRFADLGQEGRRAPTTITGGATLANQTVTFPNLVLQNPRVRMVADGSINFDGVINFIVTVDLFTQRLSNIPLVGVVIDTLSALKDSLISMRLDGTIHEPRVSPAPLQLDKLPFFEAGAQFFGAAEQGTREGIRSLDLPMPRIGLPRRPGSRRPSSEAAPDSN